MDINYSLDEEIMMSFYCRGYVEGYVEGYEEGLKIGFKETFGEANEMGKNEMIRIMLEDMSPDELNEKFDVPFSMIERALNSKS